MLSPHAFLWPNAAAMLRWAIVCAQVCSEVILQLATILREGGPKWIILAEYEGITDSYSDKGSTKYRCSPSELCIGYRREGVWGRRKPNRETQGDPLILLDPTLHWKKQIIFHPATLSYCRLFWVSISIKCLNLMLADRLQHLGSK